MRLGIDLLAKLRPRVTRSQLLSAGLAERLVEGLRKSHPERQAQRLAEEIEEIAYERLGGADGG